MVDFYASVKTPRESRSQLSKSAVRKSERSTRWKGNTENSDSDPDFDSELENEIKKFSKDTRLTRKQAKETKEKPAKGKKEEKTVKKSGKGSTNEDTENSAVDYGSDTDVGEKEVVKETESSKRRGPDAKDKKKNKGKPLPELFRNHYAPGLNDGGHIGFVLFVFGFSMLATFPYL